VNVNQPGQRPGYRLRDLRRFSTPRIVPAFFDA
jgi:hypothetical protein